MVAPTSLTLEGKVALVTGGSRGIGSAIALELARKGARVAVTFVSPGSKSKAEDTVKAVEKVHAEVGAKVTGPSAVAIQGDAGSLEAPKAIVAGTLKGLATDTIDILVNNAGVGKDQFLGEITPDTYDWIMNVNLRGVIFLTQEVLPHFPKSGGRIINLSSVSATEGFFGQTVYAAAKAGIDGLTKVWATELGRTRGITVNSVNPGPVDTDMFSGVSNEFEKMVFETCPPRSADRKGTPQDIADIIVFLAEERSRWVNGSIVNANGGAV